MSPRMRSGNTEADLKHAVLNMNETQEVHALMKEFERSFCSAKKKINDCDLVTIESELVVQALKMQYRILQTLLLQEDPNFDIEKME